MRTFQAETQKRKVSAIRKYFVLCAILLSILGGCFFAFGLRRTAAFGYADWSRVGGNATTTVVAEKKPGNNDDVSTASDNLLSSFNSTLFTDYTQTALNDEFYDLNMLNALKSSGGVTDKDYARAMDILNGNVRFERAREFSTTAGGKNNIPQVGDISGYSLSTLKFNWYASDLIVTGIYGLTGDNIKIYVQGSDSTKLPSIVFTQNHGYYRTYQWKQSIQLKLGLNDINYKDFVINDEDIDKNERKGGGIYLCNPYGSEQGRVDVYIDGGGYYPVFEKGGDETEFLGLLQEYESARKASTKMLDMAELITDHAIFTVRSSVLFNVYIDGYLNNSYSTSQNSTLRSYKPLSPNENMILWGEYMTRVFEQNGIPTSPHSEFSQYYE